MPRRGWLPAPDGWVQIIREPRPLSVKWPAASAGQSTCTGKKQGDAGGAPRSQARGRWRQPPARVLRGFIQNRTKTRHRAFGDATGPEVTMLQESQVPLVTVLPQCEQFIARAEKRLAAHDEQRILLVKQLEDCQQRLQKLREEVSLSPAPVRSPPDWEAQVASLHRMVNVHR